MHPSSASPLLRIDFEKANTTLAATLLALPSPAEAQILRHRPPRLQQLLRCITTIVMATRNHQQLTFAAPPTGTLFPSGYAAMAHCLLPAARLLDRRYDEAPNRDSPLAVTLSAVPELPAAPAFSRSKLVAVSCSALAPLDI